MNHSNLFLHSQATKWIKQWIYLIISVCVCGKQRETKIDSRSMGIDQVCCCCCCCLDLIECLMMIIIRKLVPNGFMACPMIIQLNDDNLNEQTKKSWKNSIWETIFFCLKDQFISRFGRLKQGWKCPNCSIWFAVVDFRPSPSFILSNYLSFQISNGKRDEIKKKFIRSKIHRWDDALIKLFERECFDLRNFFLLKKHFDNVFLFLFCHVNFDWLIDWYSNR